MLASNCINHEIPFLQPEDKGLTALSLLEEFKVNEMALVDKEKFIGLITEMDLLDYECIEGEIKGLKTEFKQCFVQEDDHLMDAVSLMVTENLTILPVLSMDEKYMGCIDQATIIQKIGSAEGFTAIGGVLELEIGIHDYSMAELARIVESNDLKILHFYLNSTPDSNLLHLTLKLNKSNLSRLIQSFERFGYKITATYQQDEYEEDLKRRYDSFIRYLNT